MTGAIEFLRKVKGICSKSNGCKGCPVFGLCHIAPIQITDEADLVRKVMDYQMEGAVKDE
jgi:hypothetical protein